MTSQSNFEIYIDSGYVWDFTHKFITYDALNRYVYEIYYKGLLLSSFSTQSDNYCCYDVMNNLFDVIYERVEGLLIDHICFKNDNMTLEEYENLVKKVIFIIIHRIVVWSNLSTISDILSFQENLTENVKDAQNVSLQDSFSITYKDHEYLNDYIRVILKRYGLLCEKSTLTVNRVYRG